jgi:hypothetical protein
LNTGLEKNIELTDQYPLLNMVAGVDVLYSLSQDLTDKINIWLKESPNNIITNMTILSCKERRLYRSIVTIFASEQRWTKYKSCPDEFSIRLLSLIDHPEQRGYNVNKDRLIKNLLSKILSKISELLKVNNISEIKNVVDIFFIFNQRLNFYKY